MLTRLIGWLAAPVRRARLEREWCALLQAQETLAPIGQRRAEAELRRIARTEARADHEPLAALIEGLEAALAAGRP